MKLKVKQSEKNIKVLLKQFLANDVYFMYIKNINKTLIISTQINFPLNQELVNYNFNGSNNHIGLTEIESNIAANSI